LLQIDNFESTGFLKQKDEKINKDWHFRAISGWIGHRDLVVKLKMAAL